MNRLEDKELAQIGLEALRTSRFLVGVWASQNVTISDLELTGSLLPAVTGAMLTDALWKKSAEVGALEIFGDPFTPSQKEEMAEYMDKKSSKGVANVVPCGTKGKPRGRPKGSKNKVKVKKKQEIK